MRSRLGRERCNICITATGFHAIQDLYRPCIGFRFLRVGTTHKSRSINGQKNGDGRGLARLQNALVARNGRACTTAPLYDQWDGGSGQDQRPRGGRIRDHSVNPRTRRGPLPIQDREAESRDYIPISVTDALLSLLRDVVILGF